jgi:excinuclease UvrABC nuclease subunit
MSGVNDRLLYIGQSKSLRVRLNSYKNPNPEQASRKLVRVAGLLASLVGHGLPSRGFSGLGFSSQ